MPGVVSVFPNNRRRLHMTHSWDFMGLLGEATMEIPGYSTKNQVNVVIGFIDTGFVGELHPDKNSDNEKHVLVDRPAGDLATARTLLICRGSKSEPKSPNPANRFEKTDF
ncbi:hypothetical protein HYC85_013328 [Camellia sinensis]|uniref:Peptidase S8/S53 domain-containing protein n=1 Tax=Camellia sinensis TaxID=4442 RepID=A0A7J7H565_CAMSI|nr:hypothetical protein HYC85_013328 [Camellia sinensis]